MPSIKLLTMTILACGIIFVGAPTGTALAQNGDTVGYSEESLRSILESTSEPNWLPGEIDRKLADGYDEALRSVLESGGPEENVIQRIQSHIDGTARCAVQRSFLASRTKDADRKQKQNKESGLFLSHYVYFAVVLEQNGLSKTRSLVSEFFEGRDILLNQIDQIYIANANSGDDQMSDDVFALYQACNSMLTDINLRQFAASRD